jgi:AcrR family transcriptional regulator
MMLKPDSDRHSAILDAARKRFARFGPGKVTMDEIAADMGCSKAALYYYFSTKEEIFRQVILREQQEFLDQLTVITRQDHPSSEKLREYFHHHLQLLDELLNLKIFSIAPAEEKGFPLVQDLFRQFAAKEAALLRDILAEGKSRGEFSISTPETTATLLQHALQGLRMRFAKSYRRGEINDSQITLAADEIRMLGEIVVRGISR